MTTCADLIRACIVVGSGRPSPALFVEALTDAGNDRSAIVAALLARTAEFNKHVFPHERIVSPFVVYVVPQDVKLPRTDTKGNIRRKMVEQMFASEIEEMYRLEREHATGIVGRDGLFVRVDKPATPILAQG